MRDHQLFLNKITASQTVSAKHTYKKFALISFITFSTLFFAVIHFANAAEVNPYTKNYQQQNTNNLKSLNANPDTKLLVSNHKEDDNISMLESGYDMIGSSGFSATEASPDLALQQGRAVKADTVLIYKKYESAKTASSQLQLIKEAAKKGEDIDPNDLVEEPTQYYFYASYWAKLPTPLLGVHIIKLRKGTSDNSEEGADQVQDLPGLKVIASIKDSPAAKANIVRGDTLLKIGDVDLVKADDLFAAVKRYAGQTVPVQLQRNGVDVQASVTLNARK